MINALPVKQRMKNAFLENHIFTEYNLGITVYRPQKPREKVHCPDLTDLAECKDRMEEENMNK